MTEVDADAAHTEPPGPVAAPAAGPSSRGPWLAAIAFFVVAVVLAVLAASLRSDLTAERDDRAEIERVAGELTAALLTYDYRELDAWKERVLANATGSFRRTFEDTFEQSLEPIVTEVRATSTATVKNIYLGDVDEGSATAIVVADTTADGTAGRRRSFDTYIQLDLVETGGRWRVDDVVNLNLGQGSLAGNATTTTTVTGTNN